MGEMADYIIDKYVFGSPDELTIDEWSQRETRNYFDKGKEPMNYNSGQVSWIKENPWRDKVFFTFMLDGEDSMYYQCGEGNADVKRMEIGDDVEFKWEEVTNKKGYKNKEVDLDTFKLTKGEGRIEPSTGKVQGPNIKDLRNDWKGASNRAVDFCNAILASGAITLPEKKAPDKYFQLIEAWTAAFYKSVRDDDKLLELAGLKEDKPADEDDDKPDWL